MEVLAVSVPLAAALVLLAAARAKAGTAADRRVRLLAAAEAGTAVLLLVLPAVAAGALMALTFGSFTVVHLRAYRAQAPGCNCFGEDSDEVPAGRATVLTAIAALGGAAIALFASGSALQLTLDGGGAIGAAALGVALAFGWRRLFTAGTAHGTSRPSTRLVDSTARLLEARLSRRTALQRIAWSGSALAVAPLRYLLYPATAAAIVRRTPGSCKHGLCLDGYTEFCCQIMPGGANACPEHTFPGGWWMCTDYAGRRLCHDAGVRYYVDCNANPGTTFPGGCHCAHDNCDQRRVACNIFRYGQCNTQVQGITAVVCRMVLCENPSRVHKLHCSSSVAVDDAVCAQDAPCLEPRARELVGAGGA